MSFVPLHIISGYTLLQSGLTIKAIKEEIEQRNFLGCGITDIATLSAVPPLIKELEAINKKLLVGMSISINSYALSLFCLNEEGYKNLFKVSSLIQKHEDVTEFLLASHEGLIGIIESSREEFPNALNNDKNFPSYIFKCNKLVEKLYIGIEIRSKEEMIYANKVRDFAKTYSYECIAFPRICYRKKEDAIIIDIVSAIENNEKLETKFKEGMEYFLEDKYISKLYTNEEIENTEKLLKESTFIFNKKRGGIISFTSKDKKALLEEKVFTFLKQKDLNKEPYISRANHEIEVIDSLNYDDYFFIVEDYVKYAKSHDILVGPGRGSAPGSLVSYCLGITEIDPIKYGLQFERFLNAARKTMPDIDIDFMDYKRNDMVQYMRERYGKNRVAPIVAFQTIKAKQAIRDIGRIYNFPSHHIELLCKTLTSKDYNLRDSYRKLPDFKALIDDGDYFLEIVKLAQKIEDLPRNVSLHPAGIILNDLNLEDSIPITIDENNNYVTQFEDDYLEEQGFLKMDFLALSNLTTIANCLKLIKLTKGVEIDPYQIPYDDPITYKTIASRQTAGIFQLESKGMNLAIAKLKPNCFDDIVLLLAIYRPGPMEELNTYIERRNGKPFTYESKAMEEITSSTLGVIVYQEQINSIATEVAGFSKEEADIFRRAVSKKKKAIFKENEQKFISGAIKNGYKEEVANSIFKRMTKFEDYGFNKSHSVSYAMIACEMAYLKAKYPLEFYSAILNTKIAVNDSKFFNYLRELSKIGYKIIPPSINKSSNHFEITDEGLIFPLSSIRNISDLFVTNLLAERTNNGEFKSFFNLVLRMAPLGLTSALLAKLIASGALDEFGYTRKSLEMASLGAFQRAKVFEGKNGQITLSEDLIPAMKIREYEDDPLDRLTKEYDAIWMTLSSNPISLIRDKLTKEGVTLISEINDKNIFVAGIIRDKKIIKTKKNKQNMAYVQLYDESGECEIVIFSDLYNKVSTFIDKNNAIKVKGYLRKEKENNLEMEDNSISFNANEIELININE